jgi:hypothetical protein
MCAKKEANDEYAVFFVRNNKINRFASFFCNIFNKKNRKK